jgi:uncharacterized membrane protein
MSTSGTKKDFIFITTLTLTLLLIGFLPTGFQKLEYKSTEGVIAKVISVDNTDVHHTGILKMGEQSATILIETGSYKGEIIEASNLLTGSMSKDSIYAEGDKVWTLIGFNQNNDMDFANIISYYRLNDLFLLIGVFSALIIAFSGFTGARTLLSFAFALLTIWKILLPGLLKGYNPLFMALLVGNTLTIVTLLLVAGFSMKAYAAIASSMISSIVTCLLAIYFGKLLNIHGAVLEGSESLLYSGFLQLNLTSIFQAGIYLASSGAILDLAMDISSALEEIATNNPGITRSKLVKSGLNIGKSVVGSQTTTLLFAYMGTYMTVMMVYMAQGTPLMNILNSNVISAEILHTFVGCIGLVLVAPLTSLISGFLLQTEAAKVNQSITLSS